MNYRIEKSMQVIRNLPTKAVADQQRSKTKTVAKESYLNRCLAHIERIHKVVAVDLKTKNTALEEAWKIYAFLQKFDPIVGETLHPKAENQSREVSLERLPWVADTENLDEHYADLLVENGIVKTSAPDLYAGGLGYRHVNWDAEYLMAQPKGDHGNQFWQPDKPRNKVGTPEHKAMRSLEESGYWALQPKKPDEWYKKLGCTLVESSDR